MALPQSPHQFDATAETIARRALVLGRIGVCAVGMRWLVALPALFCPALCLAQGSSHDGLMREIDAAVRMPVGARPIDDYARYYWERSDGRIAAVYTAYVRDYASKPAKHGCSATTKDGQSKDVVCLRDDRPRAGERIWTDFEHRLFFADGGCLIVNVVYDRALHRTVSVTCNGSF